MATKSKNSSNTGNSYPALKVVSVVYRFMGATLLILGGLAFFVMLISGEIIPAFGSLITTAIGAVSLLAFGQLIQVFLDIAADTHRQTKLLEYIARNSR